MAFLILSIGCLVFAVMITLIYWATGKPGEDALYHNITMPLVFIGILAALLCIIISKG